MADGQAAGRITRKCAAVPPIVINGGAPCPAAEGGPDTDFSALSTAGSRQLAESLLPQISPHRNVLGSGQPACGGTEVAHSQPQAVSQWSNGSVTTQSPFKHPSSVFPIKQEPGTAPPCAKETPNSRPTRFPFHLPLPSSSHGMHHLQLPNGLASPAFSDVSSIRLSPANFPLSPLSTTEPLRAAFKNRMRAEGRPQRIQLPPLASSCVCGSNTDLDETNPSPLNPPLKSLSPYLGSGISDIPSFPSIVSPQSSSSHHLSRKRALSTSPLSDLLDFNSLIRQSPNSLVTILNSGTPLSPSANGHHHDHVATGQGTIGHLVGQSNPAPAMQYKIQQHKTLIEHNHNSDGTTNTTITNQVTYSAEHGLMKQNMVPGGRAAQGPIASESMECKDAKPIPVHPDYDQHHHIKEEPRDPYRCMWDDCARSFDDLEDLVQHIENVHIEKGRLEHFVCLWEACPRRQKPFNARYKLLIHMRIHSGEKPNKCTYPGCNKAFSRLENLKIHLRTHTGEKPYICQFQGCHKSFSNSSDRSKHQKTHFEQKPYACNHPACSKRYTDPSSLRKHLKTHQLQRKKPRSEFRPEDGLDTCLSIQPLHCTPSSSGGPGKPNVKPDGKVKLSRHRVGKSDKHDHQAPQLVIQHHHPLPHDPPPAYSLEHALPLPPYSMADRKPPHYYHHLPPAFVAHHMTPVAPGTLYSPMVLGAEACPPLHISHGDTLAGGVQPYQVSPKIAHLSPVSGAFPTGTYTTQPSPNHPTSYMYNSNPGSPMQVAYSPAQPLLRGASNGNIYMQCNRADEMTHLQAPPTSSTPGLLRHLPVHPLPDYSHAPTLGGELFTVDGAAAAMSIGSDFPPHQMLPTADHVPNTHF